MDVFVDGELESLPGCSTLISVHHLRRRNRKMRCLVSSLYNGHLRHHHQNNRKQLHVENPHNSNSNCDVTRQVSRGGPTCEGVGSLDERLKTLQNLVPNGTKVDISTMLEEAVHYVKFLQLQIKVCTIFFRFLWMYSPLAYSGLDMGFITTFCLGSCEGLVIQIIYNLIVKKPI
ncbi:unnamed protein product [Brassica napus]|uniref:(rape) hypothetical protein n=1 Tax=Brassica napus TaxID=3708 RepID=A0A816IIP8_BRANA|nr:unnamed protein product [Brassica napus]